MSWLYEIPQWLLALFCIALCLAFSLGGLHLTRPWARKMDGKCNELAIFMGSSVAVFYAILLALVAVQASQSFSDMETLVSHEATRVSSLSRFVAAYPPETRDEIRRMLKTYIELLRDEEWPAQQRGQLSLHTSPLVTELVAKLAQFEPKTEGQKIAHQEVLRTANEFISYRRIRVQSIDNGLLNVLWMVVLMGAAITIAMTWLYWTPHIPTHMLAVGSLGFIVGLSIFVIVDQDHPFQGTTCVGMEPFQLILKTILDPLLSSAHP